MRSITDGVSNPGLSPPASGDNLLTAHYFFNITGLTLDSLETASKFPDSPDRVVTYDWFRIPPNSYDNYGVRMFGYLIPKVTGAYHLWIASDDYGSLRLSTDQNPGNAEEVASVDGWTHDEEFTKYPGQRSEEIQLVAGRAYYIEALMKEGGGGDNLSIAWTGPGVTEREIIDGEFLSTFVPNSNGGPGPTPDDGGVTLSTANNQVNGVFSVEATFNSDVTGLTQSDFDVQNGTITGLSSLSSKQYFATVDPTNEGQVITQLPAAAATTPDGTQTDPSNVLTVTYAESMPPPPPPVDPGPLSSYSLTLSTGEVGKLEFGRELTNPVVFASISTKQRRTPLVVRVANISSEGCDVSLVSLDKNGSAVSDVKVDLVVFEEGVYTEAADGVKMEIGTVQSDQVASAWNGWEGVADEVSPQQAYSNPVVIGQVQTSNSAKWTQFWAAGATVTAPPKGTDSSILIGQHIGEDPDTWREAAETIGYMIIEAGSWTFEGESLEAGTVQSRSAITPASPAGENAKVVVSLNGVADDEGSIPAHEVNADGTIKIHLQEDQLNDKEVRHDKETVGYLIVD